MGSLLGFHPPHFSEEGAWLPAWLQPSSTGDVSNEAFQCPSVRGLEEMYHLPQSISTTRYGNLSNDGGCMKFRLFLSGEDNSSMQFPSCSSTHEVQYHLHLSSYEETENSLNPILNNSKAERFEVNQTPPEKQPDIKGMPEKDTREVDCNSNEVYAVPSRQKELSENSGHKSLSLKEEKHGKANVDAGSPKVNVKDAIELAVAASEALIIHEVVKDEPNKELWTASAVLEAAIQVKHARLEDHEDTFNSSIEESCGIDFLSDLDEFAMADAYEDVGLAVASHGELPGSESAISHVKDSYASECYRSSAKLTCSEPGNLEIESGSISAEHANTLLKGGHVLEAFGVDTCQEYDDYLVVGMENVDLACDIDRMLSCSVKSADILETEVGLQKEGITIGDVTWSQTFLKSSPHRRSSGYDEREDKMTNLVPDRFQSRWFGGWTDKAATVSARTDHRCAKSIPEPFVNEISFLSESADIAPDENSCAQKHDKERKMVSESSVDAGDTCQIARNNRNLVSDDVAVSPSVSPVDPLCSVVPCSITSTDQVNLEKPCTPVANANSDTLKRVSPQSPDSRYGAEISVSKINGESSSTIRRQVTVLKNYSVLYRRQGSYLGEESTRDEPLPLKCALNFRDKNNRKIPTGDMDLRSGIKKDMKAPTMDGDNTREDRSFDIGAKESSKRNLIPQNKVCENIDNYKNPLVPRRKRVRFSEPEITPQVKKFKSPQPTRIHKRSKSSKLQPQVSRRKVGVADNKMLFENLSFLLTGFSVNKYKQVKTLIRKNGGIVFDDIPSPPNSRRKRLSTPPLILCPRRLLTNKFLYGCAVNACILKVQWLFDSIDKGSILPPENYLILKEHVNRNLTIGKPVTCGRPIFDNVAVMLHGSPKFCGKMAKVIKHGGGLVFKTLHWLIKSLDARKVSVGVMVVEDENCVSRQLKQCALEQSISLMPVNWIVNSLYAGRLLPSPEHGHTSTPLSSKCQDVAIELSEEI